MGVGEDFVDEGGVDIVGGVVEEVDIIRIIDGWMDGSLDCLSCVVIYQKYRKVRGNCRLFALVAFALSLSLMNWSHPHQKTP